MERFIRKMSRGPIGPYLEALGVLLLTAGVIYATMFSIGGSCYDPVITSTITSWESERSSSWRPDFQVRLQANARQAQPGEQATRVLGGQGDPGTTQVSYRWTPPWGATNVSFAPGSEPYPGSPPYEGPPYVWLNRDPNNEIHISYNQPGLPPGESTMLATDTAVAMWSGHESATSYTTLISNQSSKLVAPSPPAAPTGDSSSSTADLWKVGQWIDIKGITMTTGLCQDWFSLLQSDDAFLAVRAPVSPTVAITEGYPLPVVFGDPYSNTLELFSYDAFASVITVPVELRPERHTFLETELPSAPGEHWMALGLVSDTVDCSAELDPNRWSFKMNSYLDLTHQPDNCEGCVLPFYYCYEGQDAPLALAAARSALGGDVTSYQGWGITCIGPQAAPLQHDSVWGLGGAGTVWVTPTQSITLSHYLHVGVGSGPMSFDLDYAAPTLGVGWSLYGGDWTKPDLGDPLTPPLVVADGDWRPFWLVSDPVPGGTTAGAHSLVVTATETVSSDSLWAADAIWVGAWVPPPSPQALTPWLYLPLVMRSY